MRGIDLTWAGGEHNFWLAIDHLRALQAKCDAGPMFVLGRLSNGSWLVDDVIEPIRLGLEGGGLSKEQARSLIQKYVEDRPLTQSIMVARAVLMGSLMGPDDDQPGEDQAGVGTEMPSYSREESGDFQNSTSGEQSSTGTSEL